MGKNIGSVILNLMYPPHCIFCGKRLSPKANIFVCANCSNNLPFCKSYNRCKSCGNPIPEEGKICNKCFLSHSYIKASTSAFIYIDDVRSAIIAMKRYSNIGNARTFSFYVAGMVNYDFPQIDFDGVISVPPRKGRENNHRYDQAEALGKEVAKRLSLPYIPRVLYQTKYIKKQSSLTYDGRINNVKDGFGVRKPDSIKGKTLLLVDDVRTTGATLNECGKVLREAGAFRVYSATIGTTVI